MKLIFIITIFLLISITSFSQIPHKEESFVRCLSLQMTGKTKNIHFFEGDNIIVKTISDHRKHTFKILIMTDSSFFYSPYNDNSTIFDLKELKFKDIKKVYLGDSRNPISMRGFGALGGAGVMFSTIDVLNQLRTEQNIKINPAIASVSAGLIGVSYLIQVLINPNYRINKRHFFHLYHLPYTSPLLRQN